MNNKRHTIAILTEDRKGALNRITSTIRRRQYNIHSSSIGATEVRGVTKITVCLDNNGNDIDQLIKQIYKIIEVVKVIDLTDTSIKREMALVKIHHTDKTKDEIVRILDVFRAKIMGVSSDSIIISISGSPDEIEAFVDTVRFFGIKEITRTGVIAVKK